MKWLIEPLESRFAGMLCVWFAAIAVCDQIGMRDWRNRGGPARPYTRLQYLGEGPRNFMNSRV